MMTSPNIDDNGGERLRHVARIDEYRKFVETADSGLFTRKTRRRLVGKLGLSGRGLTKNDFWLDQRNRVKNALKDLEIFLMVAGSKNIRQTFTFENVKPFLGALLWSNSV